ncbi:hypothetical protein AAG906_021147 [Vitis piasezkii]
MEEIKTMKTPISSSIKLNKGEKGKSIDSIMYRGMIGSLLYLIGFKYEPLPILSLHLAHFPSSMALRREPTSSRA